MVLQIAPVRRALLSVYDKTGIVELAKMLAKEEVEILSTGGTGRALKEAGIAYLEVGEYTGSPEMLGGRVKTLHPKVHGGILFKREDPEQAEEAERHGVAPIDLVAINLYPFTQTVAKPDVTLDEAVENIDIGGPAMIRAASKNFYSVTALTDPTDYASVMEELMAHRGVSLATRRWLAAKAFSHTCDYDYAIANYLSGLE